MLRRTLDRLGHEPVLICRADGTDAVSLRREIAVLTALADLSVPGLRRVDDDGTVVEAVTAHHPRVRRPTCRHLVEAVAVLTAAHARNVTHGAFGPRCIAADRDGRTIVDGWLGTGTPADDVAAAGAVLAALDPEPAHARPARRRRTLVASAGALLALASVVASSAPFRPSAASSRSATAPTVVAGGQRWQVGDPGDAATAGDWDCDGDDEPALLRPDGSVWRWTDLGGAPVRVGSAVAATTLSREPLGPGCDRIVARDGQGAVVATRVDR